MSSLVAVKMDLKSSRTVGARERANKIWRFWASMAFVASAPSHYYYKQNKQTMQISLICIIYTDSAIPFRLLENLG